MEFNQFPYTYKEGLEKDANQKISEITQKRNESINKLDASKRNTVRNLNSFKSTGNLPAGPYMGGGGIIGLIVGVFVCFTNGDAIDSQIHFSASLGSAFAFWFMFGVIGGILGLIIWGLIAAAQSRSNKSIDNRIASTEKNADSQIAKETKRFDKVIGQVRQEADAQYKVYLQGFNAEAQKMSVRFAESSLAVEVIDWMTSGFANTIDAADRRSHVQEINIPFVFKTYRNKIECNLGTFDFEIKRCDELETPLEQTALTRAIASAIQLNITMKYPQDASGTNIVTNISYAYYKDYVSATIIYTATNGNYKKTKSWTEK